MYRRSIPLTTLGVLQLINTASSDTREVLTLETGPGTAKMNVYSEIKTVHILVMACSKWSNLQPSSVVLLAKALNGPVPFTLAAATLHEYSVKEANPVSSCWWYGGVLNVGEERTTGD